VGFVHEVRREEDGLPEIPQIRDHATGASRPGRSQWWAHPGRSDLDPRSGPAPRPVGAAARPTGAQPAPSAKAHMLDGLVDATGVRVVGHIAVDQLVHSQIGRQVTGLQEPVRLPARPRHQD
jgi:hypothetical protein